MSTAKIYRCTICGGLARHINRTAIHLDQNGTRSDYDHNAVIAQSSIGSDIFTPDPIGAHLSDTYRFTHPTTADIYAVLDCEHCEECEGWGTGIQPWWTDPNTVQGRDQLDQIGAHILETYKLKNET